MSRNNKPEISVLIVCHNYAHFLEQCLASVWAQTFTDYEVVLVDDGSTDATGQIVARYPHIHYIKQAHRGVGASRNTAITAAQGKYLAFLDADDYWPEQRLARLLGWTKATASPKKLVFGAMRNFYQSQAVADISLARIMAARSQAALPSLALLPKTFFATYGQFDENLPYGEDSDFISRLQAAKVEFAYNNALVLHRRLHGENISLRLRTEQSLRENMLRRQAAIIRQHRISAQ